MSEEVSDRGFFGLGEKKEEEAAVTEVEKLHIEEVEQKKHGLFDKLHRSGSSSSSSSDDEEEEEGEDGEKKKKKKKGLKEKLHGEKKEEGEAEVKQEVLVAQDEGTTIVVEKVAEESVELPAQEEEKKGFLDKIKEKLHKKPAEEGAATTVVTPPPPAVEGAGEHHDGEKKGFLEKIKEKLPGYHKSSGEEGEKSPASH